MTDEHFCKASVYRITIISLIRPFYIRVIVNIAVSYTDRQTYDKRNTKNEQKIPTLFPEV